MGSWHRDKGDDLALFQEMQARERRKFLCPLNNGIEGSSPTMTPPRKGSELLASDTDKSDYDWLLTPPGTPLFPYLDQDVPIVNLSQRRVLARSTSGSISSRLSYVQEASAAEHPSVATASTISTANTNRGRSSSLSLVRSSPAKTGKASNRSCPSSTTKAGCINRRSQLSSASAKHNDCLLSGSFREQPSTLQSLFNHSVEKDSFQSISPKSKNPFLDDPDFHETQSHMITPDALASCIQDEKGSQTSRDSAPICDDTEDEARFRSGKITSRNVLVGKQVLPSKRLTRSCGSKSNITSKRSSDSQKAQHPSSQTMFRPLMSTAPATSFFNSKYTGLHQNLTDPSPNTLINLNGSSKVKNRSCNVAKQVKGEDFTSLAFETVGDFTAKDDGQTAATQGDLISHTNRNNVDATKSSRKVRLDCPVKNQTAFVVHSRHSDCLKQEHSDMEVYGKSLTCELKSSRDTKSEMMDVFLDQGVSHLAEPVAHKSPTCWSASEESERSQCRTASSIIELAWYSAQRPLKDSSSLMSQKHLIDDSKTSSCSMSTADSHVCSGSNFGYKQPERLQATPSESVMLCAENSSHSDLSFSLYNEETKVAIKLPCVSGMLDIPAENSDVKELTAIHCGSNSDPVNPVPELPTGTAEQSLVKLEKGNSLPRFEGSFDELEDTVVCGVLESPNIKAALPIIHAHPDVDADTSMHQKDADMSVHTHADYGTACEDYKRQVDRLLFEELTRKEAVSSGTQKDYQPNALSLKRNVTLEEATDTILFCSSIMHELIYKAASIAIQREEQKGPKTSGSKRDFALPFGFSGKTTTRGIVSKAGNRKGKSTPPVQHETLSLVQKQKLVQQRTPSLMMQQSLMATTENAVIRHNEGILSQSRPKPQKTRHADAKKVSCSCNCCIM